MALEGREGRPYVFAGWPHLVIGGEVDDLLPHVVIVLGGEPFISSEF